MKRIYEFVFFCIYSMVPKKSMYGQRNAAVVLISLVDCAVATSLYIVSLVLYRDLGRKPIPVIFIGVTVIASFVLNSRFFETRTKIKEITTSFGPGAVSHRLYGAGIVLATFIIYISIIVFADRYIAAHSI